MPLPPPPLSKRTPYLSQSLSSKSLVAPLLLLAFVTGVLDATTYADFSTFASNQTGNVILLTVAAASVRVQGNGVNLLHTGVSLASYLISGFIFGQLGHRAGSTKRWWLLLSNVGQVIALLITTILLYTGAVQVNDERMNWILLLLLAVSSGMQVAIARNCGIGEIPTAMLSSPMIDLITDRYLFDPHWTRPAGSNRPSLVPRNRRLLYIFTLVGGSFIGAFMHARTGTAPVLVLSTIGKAILIPWLYWIKVEVKDEGEKWCVNGASEKVPSAKAPLTPLSPPTASSPTLLEEEAAVVEQKALFCLSCHDRLTRRQSIPTSPQVNSEGD